MKTLYALPVILAASFAMSGAASAQGAGAFSYQKQWWPDAATTAEGASLGSGEAYAYGGPSGPDLWNDPRVVAGLSAELSRAGARILIQAWAIANHCGRDWQRADAEG